MTFIAKDMKIQVEFNPSHVYAYRLLGYEDRAIADNDFRNDVVDAGEVGAGHRVTALYELALTKESLPDLAQAPKVEDGDAFAGTLEVEEGALALVKIRYKDRDASETDAAHEVSQALLPAQLISDVGHADADFAWAVAVASLAEILKGSPYAAKDALSKIYEIANRPAYADDADRKERAELAVLSAGGCATPY